MPSVENLKVLIALLPGFLSQRIAHYFGTQYRVSDINTIVSALAFTFVNFFIAIPICKIFKIQIIEDDKGMNFKFLFIMLISSLVTGFGWAIIDRSDLLYEIPLTTKATQAHLWTKIFRTNTEEKDWKAAVKVTLKDDITYIGWGRYWSEQQEQNNILFLNRAYVLLENGECSMVNGPGVMLFQNEMKYIEFISVPDCQDHPCKFKEIKKDF